MNRLKLILSFFTRIYVGNIDYSDGEFEKSIKLTPVVGVIIGFILLVIAILLRNINNNLVAGFILSVIYLFLTGGLHFDGLSDSFDGLFSGRDKDRILEIMKDSRVGAFGVLALIVSIIGYIIFLGDSSFETIAIFPIVGRCSLYIASRFGSYGRVSGMGQVFVEKGNTKGFRNTFILTNLAVIVIAVTLKRYYIIPAMLIAYFSAYRIIRFSHSKIDGITGDVLGMIVELSQLSFLIASYIIASFL